MKSLAVGFDVSALDPEFKAHAARGIGRYVRELSAYLDRGTSSGIAPITVAKFSYKDLLLPSSLERSLQRIPVGRQTLRQQVVYPLQLSGGIFRRFDVLHFPAHMDAPSWSNKPYILTVLDLIPLVLRELYESPGNSLRFRFARFLELRAIRAASLILAISECTAADVTRILGIPPERIRVTPLGVDASFGRPVRDQECEEVRHRYALPPGEPIVLYVGGIDQRKNVARLVEVFAKVVRMARDRPGPLPRLVMAGHIHEDKHYPMVCAKVRELGLEDRVTFTGFVAGEDLLPLYRLASVFLFLSLYEGFGLPPLEALAAGTPVVSSNRGALAEVLRGSPGIAVDPDKLDDVASRVLEVIGWDAERRRTLGEEGQRHAAMFSWERTGAATVAAYEEYLRGLKG